jgi:hypothetical protein
MCFYNIEVLTEKELRYRWGNMRENIILYASVRFTYALGELRIQYFFTGTHIEC